MMESMRCSGGGGIFDAKSGINGEAEGCLYQWTCVMVVDVSDGEF